MSPVSCKVKWFVWSWSEKNTRFAGQVLLHPLRVLIAPGGWHKCRCPTWWAKRAPKPSRGHKKSRIERPPKGWPTKTSTVGFVTHGIKWYVKCMYYFSIIYAGDFWCTYQHKTCSCNLLDDLRFTTSSKNMAQSLISQVTVVNEKPSKRW